MNSRSRAFPGRLKRSWIALLLLISCSHAPHGREYSPQDACALLDSLYASALLPIPYSIRGKARFDVNQYRLRGTFVLSVHAPGDPGSAGGEQQHAPGTAARANRAAERVFDFVSSSYFGSHREDITISMMNDGIWILDRERGAYYEDAEADRFIRERLDISGNFGEVIGFATGSAPACELLTQPVAHTDSRGEISIRGLVGGRRAGFMFGADRGRIREIIWPFEVQPNKIEELRISYGWSDSGDTLESILLILESLNWQIKLTVTETAR